MSELLGNYAIITGASRGLGAGMAVRLAKMGYNIVINYQSDASKVKAENVLKEAAQYGAEGLAVQADVSEFEGAKALVDAAIAKFGRSIGVLINNAGIQQNAFYVDTPIEQVHRIVQVNLVSALNMCTLVAPIMKENQTGTIISTSSTGGLMGVPMQTVYCATKAASSDSREDWHWNWRATISASMPLRPAESRQTCSRISRAMFMKPPRRHSRSKCSVRSKILQI